MGNTCVNPPSPTKSTQNTASATTNKVLTPNFTANIRELHKQYVKHVLHVRKTKFFKQRTDLLVNSVKKYFQNGFKFDKDDLNLGSIDAVRKLHPKDYWENKIDQQWLISACLRQQKFSDQTRVELITFDHAFPAYMKFLRLCRYNIMQKNGAITVPSKCQDVIWHSHMQDPEKYKADMIKFMGRLLNHMDDIPDEQLKKHSERTKQLYNQINSKPKQLQNKQYQNQINLGLNISQKAIKT